MEKRLPTPEIPALAPSAFSAGLVAIDVRMWRHSGIGAYLRGMLRAMAAFPEPPDLLCLGPDPILSEIRSETGADQPKWQFEPFRAHPYSISEMFPPARTVRECSLYHAPHYNYPFFWPKGKKLVVTIHDLIHLESANPLKRQYMRFFLNRLQARSKDKTHIITGSQATRTILLQAAPRLDPSQVAHIPYGLGPQFLSPAITKEALEVFRCKWDLPEEFLLMVGIPLSHKNHEFALKAILPLVHQGKLPPVVFCGAGENGKKLFSHLAPPSALHFLGHLDDAEMPLLYQCASALIFPSLVEGFGLPIVEALAMRTPVIVSDRPAPREAAGDAGYFFDPCDAESLLSAIDKCLGDSDLRRVRAEIGLRRIADLTWHNTAMKTLDIYRLMLHK